MDSRKKVIDIFNHRGTMGAMWTGKPNVHTVPILAKAWNIEETPEAIYSYLDDDCRWVKADKAYHHPEGRPMFDPSYGMVKGENLGAEGCFAETESLSEIGNYPWPDVKYFNFQEIYDEIDLHADKMVFSGLWSPFFHHICEFFGMENYFIKMYDSPEIVEAVTEKVADFYVEANEIFFEGLGDRADVMFFGNDFGTQLDMLISPDLFKQFLLPTIKRLIAVGKKYNKKIMLHSCGSIYRIIPDLIDAGVDILHPIQAQAEGMSAMDLKQYKNDLAFVGGIDAQTFFVNATPQQIKDEVHRVQDILGQSIVISPSHEAVLPNVPPENLLAMAQAARE